MTIEEPVPWLSDEEQRAWRAYLRGSRLLEAALNADLQAHGGTQITEYELVSMLSEAPGQRMRMSQLADSIVQSRSRVTHTASRLEDRGWVRRESSQADRRGVELVLTSQGRAALDRMSAEHVRSVRRNLVDLLTPAQFAALGKAMGIVRDSASPGHHEIGIDD